MCGVVKGCELRDTRKRLADLEYTHVTNEAEKEAFRKRLFRHRKRDSISGITPFFQDFSLARSAAWPLGHAFRARGYSANATPRSNNEHVEGSGTATNQLPTSS